MGPAQRRPRRRRGLKALVITLIILLGLAIAADFGAAATAEYQVSKRMRAQLQLTEDPSVRVNGFPFLYQAFSGDYPEVEVKANGVPVGALRDVGIEATLRHVRVPLSDLLSGTAKTVEIDEVTGRVRISASDVGRDIGVTDLKIEPATQQELNGEPPAGPEPAPAKPADKSVAAVKLTGSADIAGARTQVVVVGVLTLKEGSIEVSPKTIKLSNNGTNIPLAPAVNNLVRKLFTKRIDFGRLPFTVVPTGVQVDSGALVVEGSAKKLTLGGPPVKAGTGQ